jgi:hypothetical protein
MSYTDNNAGSFSIKLKISLEVVAVVFLEEPLRLTLRERVCLLGKVALEFNPVARAFYCFSI